MLERANMEPSAILSWIQIRNKNILDFTLMDGEQSIISKEEFAFKNFFAANRGSGLDARTQGNSSKQFYRFLRHISY